MLQVNQGCNHADARPWVQINFDVKSGKDTRFGDLLWCPDCQKGFARQMPAPEEIAAHYDLESYYTQGAASHMPDVPVTLADRILTKLAWTFDDPPAPLATTIAGMHPTRGRFLDIGCGNGDVMAAVRQLGFDVIGVDPDPAARATAEHAGMKACEGTAEDLPASIASERFDVITMTHVLEHCLSPRTALANARACLADDGLFYCEVPNCGATYFTRSAQISEMLDVPRHLHFFTKKSLEALCDTVGLTVIDWRYHGYTRHYKAAWRAWENGIHDRISQRGEPLQAARRNFARSVKLIFDTARAAPDRKFDCIGFFAKRA